MLPIITNAGGWNSYDHLVIACRGQRTEHGLATTGDHHGQEVTVRFEAQVELNQSITLPLAQAIASCGWRCHDGSTLSEVAGRAEGGSVDWVRGAALAVGVDVVGVPARVQCGSALFALATGDQIELVTLGLSESTSWCALLQLGNTVDKCFHVSLVEQHRTVRAITKSANRGDDAVENPSRQRRSVDRQELGRLSCTDDLKHMGSLAHAWVKHKR